MTAASCFESEAAKNNQRHYDNLGKLFENHCLSVLKYCHRTRKCGVTCFGFNFSIRFEKKKAFISVHNVHFFVCCWVISYTQDMHQLHKLKGEINIILYYKEWKQIETGDRNRTASKRNKIHKVKSWKRRIEEKSSSKPHIIHNSLSGLVWWWYLTCHQPSPAPNSVKKTKTNIRTDYL